VLFTEDLQIDRITLNNVDRLEVAGEPSVASELSNRLRARNGGPEFDLTLVGRQPDIRHSYRVRVAVLDPVRLVQIDDEFHRTLNVPGASAAIVDGFVKNPKWHDRPEEGYAKGLASFRVAIMLREDWMNRRDSRPMAALGVDYRHHFGDCRSLLGGIDRSLARTILAASAFVDNEFRGSWDDLGDKRLANAIRFFQGILLNRETRLGKIPVNDRRLVLDSLSAGVIDMIDAHRAGHRQEVTRHATEVIAVAASMADRTTQMKATVAAWFLKVPGVRISVLHDDPIFGGLVERAR
jgi:hypothetical protein